MVITWDKMPSPVGNIAADQKILASIPWQRFIIVFTAVEIGQLGIDQLCQRVPLVGPLWRQAALACLGRLCAIAQAAHALRN